MYFGKYAPWEHYPRNLTREEIQYPLHVIDDFFRCANPGEHIRDLKKWRKYVIDNSRFYKDKKNGPGILVFIHELNLKLLEGAFLLLLEYQQNKHSYIKPKDDQARLEKDTWVYYPDNLSAAELLNPFQAIKHIFKKVSPQLYRDHLNQWLHDALCINIINEDMDPREIILIYENLLKLYAAAWLIYKRTGAGNDYQEKTTKESVVLTP